MDYMTLKEASEKWGVTPRWINYYCSAMRAGCQALQRLEDADYS